LLLEFGSKTTCGENPKGKTQQQPQPQPQPAGQPELLFWLTGCLRVNITPAEARVIATRALAEKPNSFLLGQVMVMSNLASNKVRLPHFSTFYGLRVRRKQLDPGRMYRKVMERKCFPTVSLIL
ncbi:hypothetical protein ANCDUO_21992, partial [Ancylostoma duodenale]